MQRYENFKTGPSSTRLKIGLYYAQRVVTNRSVRHMATHILVSALKAFRGSDEFLIHYKTSLAEHMRKAGYIDLGKLLRRDQCDEIHCYLREHTMIDVRGAASVFGIDQVPEGARMGDYPLETVVNCPHILEVANQPDLLKLIGSYLGYKPTITNIGLRWSFPGGSSGDQVQSFHRDAELGSAKVLIYLTDVDNASGPHVYVEGTHRERMPLRLHTYSNDEIARTYGSGIHMLGCAGTGFAIDTRGIHKGVPPTSRPRLLLVIQYSLLPGLLYDYAPVRGVRAGRFDPYINRLIIADDHSSVQPVHHPVAASLPALHE